MNPVLWMLSSSALFSIMTGFIKSLHRLPTWEVVFFRSFINFLILVPWALKARVPNWRRDMKFLLIRGLAGCSSMFLYFYAITHMRLADAVMLNYSSPIIVLVLSALLLGERLTYQRVVCIAIAFLGIGFILKPGFDMMNLAGLAGLSSALTAGIAYVAIKVATRTVPTNFIVFTFAAVASAISFVPMLASFTAPTPREWLFLLASGVIAAGAQSAMTKSYSRLPASVGSPLSLSTVVFSTLIGWAFWGEVPDRWSIFGGVLVGLGLLGAHLKFHAKDAIS